MIYVVNDHYFERGEKVCIDIMRPSAVGNPFFIGKDGNRDEVINRYRRWLWEEIKIGDTAACYQLDNIMRMAMRGDIYLVCCCAPKKCHGDIIKSCVEWMMKKGG